MSAATCTTYEVRLRGTVPAHLVAAIGRVACVVEVPAQTMLRTARSDPAAVHALVQRLSDFGIELLDLRRCADGQADVTDDR